MEIAMPSCFVPDCKSNDSDRKDDVLLFSPPKDVTLFLKWQQKLMLPDRKLARTDHVCSLHFPPEKIEYYYTHKMNGEELKVLRGTPKLSIDAIPNPLPKPIIESEKRKPPLITMMPRKKGPAFVGVESIDEPDTPVKLAPVKPTAVSVTKVVLNPATPTPALRQSKPIKVDIIFVSKISDLIKNLDHVVLPSKAWGKHVNASFNSVCFSHLSDNVSTMCVDRIIKLDATLKPKLVCNGREVSFPRNSVNKIYDLRDVNILLKYADSLQFCRGVEELEPLSKLSLQKPLHSRHCTILVDGNRQDSSTPSVGGFRCRNCYKVECATRNFFSDIERRKTLQQRNRRLTGRLKLLKEVVAELRKECSKKQQDDFVELLKKVPHKQRRCVDACIRAAKAKAVPGKRYTRGWIHECMLMRIQSPHMYLYMRKKAILPLPSLQTLRKYMKSVNYKPAVEELLFEAVEQKRCDSCGQERRRELLFKELKSLPGINVNLAKKAEKRNGADKVEAPISVELGDHAYS